MKFKVTLRNKFTADIETLIIEADDEIGAMYEADETPNSQVLSIRPLRSITDKAPKFTKPIYVSIHTLRARHERDLCNKQMGLGKYA